MRSSEFDQILASLQDVVHRAYVLGRSDALKHVVEVMQSDESLRKPLALAAPSPEPAPIEPEPEAVHAEPSVSARVPEPATAAGARPAETQSAAWWARPPRGA